MTQFEQIGGVILVGAALMLAASFSSLHAKADFSGASQSQELALRAAVPGSPITVANYVLGTHTCYLFRSFKRTDPQRLVVSVLDTSFREVEIEVYGTPSVVIFETCMDLA